MIGDVARLAPDAAALGAAQRIAVRPLWPVLARSERALWGEVEGSERYHVAVDLADHVGRCTCPSRKHPCKHVLALMLMAGDLPALAPEPTEVASWIEKRQAARAPREKGPVKDLEGQLARREQREARVADGLARLERFLDDVVRQGLGALDGPAGERLLEGEARRLVDNQATGLAARVRGVASRIAEGGDWAGAVLDRLGRLALLGDAWRRMDALSPALQADVRAHIGFSFPEEEVLAWGDVVADSWFVLSDTSELDGALKIGRTWLRGRTSSRDALLLRYCAAGASFSEVFLPGSEHPGRLAFYPGAHPQKALVVELAPALAPAPADVPRPVGVTALLSGWADALAEAPWLWAMPVVLGPVEVTAAQAFDEGGAVPIAVADPSELLALAGGHPITLVGEWSGARLGVLAVRADGGYETFAPAPPARWDVPSRWADLAVIGSVRWERRRSDGAPGPLDDPELAPLDGSPERRLLLAAGVEALARSAGRRADPRPEPLPPAPPERAPTLPRALVERADAMLGDPHLGQEVVASFARLGLVLPPRLITRALPLVRKRDDLLPALGARGRWLADLAASPAWVEAYARAPHAEEPARVFVEGATDARRAALAELRRRDPGAVRELLRATWREDKPELRASWLEVLRDHGLSDADVPLLEGVAGGDRSQPVRRLARAVLGELAGTAVHVRHRARVAAVMPTPGVLALPVIAGDRPPDPDWLEDGLTLDAGLGAGQGLGPRAALLAALARGASPALWAEVSGLAVPDLVAAVAAGEHAHAFLLGLAGRPLPAPWAEAVAFAIPGLEWPSGLRAARDALGPALLDRVPEPARDRLRARWYLKSPRVAFDDWGPELSRAVLRDLEHQGPRPDLPPRVVYALHPSLIALALEQLAGKIPQRQVGVLELRRVFHQELVRVRNALAKP